MMGCEGRVECKGVGKVCGREARVCGEAWMREKYLSLSQHVSKYQHC